MSLFSPDLLALLLIRRGHYPVCPSKCPGGEQRRLYDGSVGYPMPHILLTALALLLIVGIQPITAQRGDRWPSFRGPSASGVGDDVRLPDRWNVKDGTNMRWKVAVPGLAHSSPIVWGDRVFVTTAVSSRGGRDVQARSLRRGHRVRGSHVAAVGGHGARPRAPARRVWQRTAYEGVPREKRHIKATYANATPATDGRYVVAFFGSQGLYALRHGRPAAVEEGPRRAQHRRLRSAGVRVGHGELADHLQGPGDRAVRHAERVVRAGGGHRRPGRRSGRRCASELPSWGTPTVYPAAATAGPPSSSPTRRTSSAATIPTPATSAGGWAAARRSPRRRRSSPAT